MSHVRRTIAFVLLFSSFALPSVHAAEKAESVRAEAKVLKHKIKIGDELRLLVQVEHPRKFILTPLTEKIPVAPFEVKAMDADPIHKGANRVLETFGFTLTVFELGDLKIPSIPVEYRDEYGHVGVARTEPVDVNVVSVGKKLTDRDDIRAIKGPVSVGLLRFRSWLFGLVAAALSVFLAIRVIRRWIRRQKDLESRKPPHVRARIELDRLKNQGLLQDKKVKEHYSGLSDVLRRYMERAMDLEALERTTFEILQEMKEKKQDPSVVAKIKDVLEETDLVKFAKSEPERATAERLEREILEVVEMTLPADGMEK